MLFRCRSSLLVLWYPELFKEETYEVAKFDESMSNVALSFLDENDVLYANSSPAFFDKGFRWYLILRTSVNKIPGIKSSSKIDLWVKYAATHYFELDKIGSELNEIQGEKRSEIKLQLIYSR